VNVDAAVVSAEGEGGRIVWGIAGCGTGETEVDAFGKEDVIDVIVPRTQ